MAAGHGEGERSGKGGGHGRALSVSGGCGEREAAGFKAAAVAGGPLRPAHAALVGGEGGVGDRVNRAGEGVNGRGTGEQGKGLGGAGGIEARGGIEQGVDVLLVTDDEAARVARVADHIAAAAGDEPLMSGPDGAMLPATTERVRVSVPRC